MSCTAKSRAKRLAFSTNTTEMLFVFAVGQQIPEAWPRGHRVGTGHRGVIEALHDRMAALGVPSTASAWRRWLSLSWPTFATFDRGKEKAPRNGGAEVKRVD